MEVYIARLNKNVVYIGSGLNGRHKHVNSGTSHVYELNKLHFQGVIFDIEFLGTNYSKEESLTIEKGLIEKYQPIYNRVYKDKTRSFCANKQKDFYKKLSDYYQSLYLELSLTSRQKTQYKKYLTQLLALIKEFKLSEVPALVTFPIVANINSEYKTVHRILIGENNVSCEFKKLFESIIITKHSTIPRSFYISIKETIT